MAEHCALASVFFYAEQGTHAVGDCSSTIDSFNCGQTWAEGYARATASVWRSIRMYSKRTVASVSHVKAHRSLSAVDPNDFRALADFHGNRQADLLAKKANILHPDCSEASSTYRSRFLDLKMIALHIGRALSLFPSFRKAVAGLPFTKPVRTPGGPRYKSRHDTIWFGDQWLCTQCCTLSRFKAGPSHACPGRHSLADALIADQKVHALAVVVADGCSCLFFCKRCGCFAAVKGVGLLDPCRITNGREPDRMGKQCLRRIYAGKHPTHKSRTVSVPVDLILPPRLSLTSGASSAKIFGPL